MTSRQRILEAIRHGSPDRVPVSPFTLGALDPFGAAARELIEKTDPLIPVGGGGNPFIGSAVTPRVVQDGDTRITTYDTPKGPLTTRFRWTGITGATTEYAVKSPEDAERFLSMPFEPATVDLTEYWEWCARVGEEALILVGIPNAVCLPASWLSPEDFCMWWLDYPNLIAELTKVAAERLNEWVHRLCKEGAEAFRIVGGEYASVQLGPSGFDALVTPFDTELVDIIHSYGAIAYYHNHGCMSRFLERLADLGIDALDPVEAPPWGDVEIDEAVRRIGDRVCLVGNLDDMEIIEALPTEEVVAIAEERLASAGSRGFILGGTASGTYTEKGARNFIAMAEMVRGK
jgi:hypothetical protein